MLSVDLAPESHLGKDLGKDPGKDLRWGLHLGLYFLFLLSYIPNIPQKDTIPSLTLLTL